jgi:poly(A) polymerase
MPRSTSSRQSRARPDQSVRQALLWACEVATKAPDALEHPPARPAEEQLRSFPVPELRRILDELVLGQHIQHGLDALLQMGVLEVWLPELQALVGFGDGEWRHKDLWKHSKQVVWQSEPRLAVRWGALLHDIGKVKTRRVAAEGQVRFLGHSEVGAAMFRKRIAPRLAFTGELYQRVHYLILHHLRASQYDPGWTDSAVRRFTREMGEGLEDLLALSRADITTKRPERRKQGLNLIAELGDRIVKLQIEDARVPPLPKGLGNLIMERFGIPPSRRVGDIRRLLERRVEEGKLEAGREAEYYVEWLQANRQEAGL